MEKVERIQYPRHYGTQEEIEYLKGLGRSPHGVSRTEMLRRYRQGMERRQRWGMIDPEIIRTYLDLEIGGNQP
jgi:hypothetical protein